MVALNEKFNKLKNYKIKCLYKSRQVASGIFTGSRLDIEFAVEFKLRAKVSLQWKVSLQGILIPTQSIGDTVI